MGVCTDTQFDAKADVEIADAINAAAIRVYFMV
jgi:hypothetical protein